MEYLMNASEYFRLLLSQQRIALSGVCCWLGLAKPLRCSRGITDQIFSRNQFLQPGTSQGTSTQPDALTTTSDYEEVADLRSSRDSYTYVEHNIGSKHNYTWMNLWGLPEPTVTLSPET